MMTVMFGGEGFKAHEWKHGKVDVWYALANRLSECVQELTRILQEFRCIYVRKLRYVRFVGRRDEEQYLPSSTIGQRRTKPYPFL